MLNILYLSCVIAMIACSINSVAGHGKMLLPAIRPVSKKYRERVYEGIKIKQDYQIQEWPMRFFMSFDDPAKPAAADFTFAPCRGMLYEEENPVTPLEYNKPFNMTYTLLARHPGSVTMSILKDYKKVAELIKAPFGNDVPGRGTRYQMVIPGVPTSVTGCDVPGACVLQFHWVGGRIPGGEAPQVYYNCADITLPKSADTAAYATPAAAPAYNTPAPVPAAPVAAPAYNTPAPIPAAAPVAAAPVSTPSKCNRKN